MTLDSLVRKIIKNPNSIDFNEVISTIEQNYRYKPTKFTNGGNDQMHINEAGENERSCKIFAFAKMNKLTENQTLACFGSYYRIDVLENPKAEDHVNIRNFIDFGWQGIKFESEALKSII